MLRDTVRRHGVPGAGTATVTASSRRPRRWPLTLEEQLADTRTPTQLGRALAELGIGSIAARSPQAKGRIERAWGTLQDRLVSELRLAGATDRESANRVLARFLPRFNRRFGVPATNPVPAWRALPAGVRLERVCCAPLPPGRRRRRDGPGRGDDPAAAGPAYGAQPLGQASGSSSSSASTAGWSCGTASVPSSRPRPPPTRSSSGRSMGPGSTSAPPPRVPQPGRAPSRLPTIPGAECRSTAGATTDPTDRITEQMT